MTRSSSDESGHDGSSLFIDTKVEVLETMLSAEEVNLPEPPPAGLASVPTRPAPIPAGSGNAAARSAPATDGCSPAAAGAAPNPAWKEALREKVHRWREKRRARREAPGAGGTAGRAGKKRKRADTSAAAVAAAHGGGGRGSPGAVKRRKPTGGRADGEPPSKARIGKDGFTIRGQDGGENGGSSRSASPATGRRAEQGSDRRGRDDSKHRDSTRMENSKRKDCSTEEDDSKRSRPYADRDRPGSTKSGRLTSPTPPQQSAQDRTPQPSPSRSLLLDRHGRKVSRAGVTVETKLTDLLDSMVRGGAATARGERGSGVATARVGWGSGRNGRGGGGSGVRGGGRWSGVVVGTREFGVVWFDAVNIGVFEALSALCVELTMSRDDIIIVEILEP